MPCRRIRSPEAGRTSVSCVVLLGGFFFLVLLGPIRAHAHQHTGHNRDHTEESDKNTRGCVAPNRHGDRRD